MQDSPFLEVECLTPRKWSVLSPLWWIIPVPICILCEFHTETSQRIFPFHVHRNRLLKQQDLTLCIGWNGVKLTKVPVAGNWPWRCYSYRALGSRAEAFPRAFRGDPCNWRCHELGYTVHADTKAPTSFWQGFLGSSVITKAFPPQLPQRNDSHWPHLLLPGVYVMCACVSAALRLVWCTYLDTTALCETAPLEKNNWLPWIIASSHSVHRLPPQTYDSNWRATSDPCMHTEERNIPAFSILRIPTSTLLLLFDSQDTKPQAEQTHW